MTDFTFSIEVIGSQDVTITLNNIQIERVKGLISQGIITDEKSLFEYISKDDNNSAIEYDDFDDDFEGGDFICGSEDYCEMLMKNEIP